MTTATVHTAGQVWSVAWSQQRTPPPGINHGSSAVCWVDRQVVLVSRDGERWELPAGRPEGAETLLETMRREVLEEACCDVSFAELLGFTTSTCLEGREQGRVLVRAHWAARATARPWRPLHEISHRILLPYAEAIDRLTVDPGFGTIDEQMWALAAASQERS